MTPRSHRGPLGGISYSQESPGLAGNGNGTARSGSARLVRMRGQNKEHPW